MIRIINTQGFTGWFLRLRDVSSLPSVSMNLTAGLRRESAKVLVTPSCPTLLRLAHQAPLSMGLNLGLLHCRQILHCLSYWGSPL